MSKGHDRERQVRRLLEAQGYWVCRAAGSLGDADLVACYAVNPAKAEQELVRGDKGRAYVLLVEVKSNKDGGPYMNFRRSDRKALKEAAAKAGAEAVLCYWPARKEPRWLPSSEWP